MKYCSCWKSGCICDRKVSFPKTQRLIAQFRNLSESRQSCSCQLVRYPLSYTVAIISILTLSVVRWDTTIHCHFRNRTESRQPCSSQLLLFNLRSYSLSVSIILGTQQRKMPMVGIKLVILRLPFGTLTDLSYAASLEQGGSDSSR